jgi:hypothetical protein
MNKVGTENLNKVEKCLIMSLTLAGDGSRLSNDVTTILRYMYVLTPIRKFQI